MRNAMWSFARCWSFKRIWCQKTWNLTLGSHYPSAGRAQLGQLQVHTARGHNINLHSSNLYFRKGMIAGPKVPSLNYHRTLVNPPSGRGEGLDCSRAGARKEHCSVKKNQDIFFSFRRLAGVRIHIWLKVISSVETFRKMFLCANP